MDPATFKVMLDAGNFGLLAVMLIWGLPKLLDRFDRNADKRDATFREEMQAEREAHTKERADDRQAFTEAIDRNSKAVEANTTETKALAELVRKQTAKG
ncbi:MAG: hypothetical protein IT435_05540 [Phycisphaerales bacterium]|nr:hypothetical protein [Phycisphaerales bacterium]